MSPTERRAERRYLLATATGSLLAYRLSARRFLRLSLPLPLAGFGFSSAVRLGSRCERFRREEAIVEEEPAHVFDSLIERALHLPAVSLPLRCGHFSRGDDPTLAAREPVSR